MSIELKIKAKHLAEESKIIRHEERKLTGFAQWLKRKDNRFDSGIRWEQVAEKRNQIKNHRRWDVRNEARATHLARAFLAGRPYRTVEAKSDSHFVHWYIRGRVVKMVEKYGNFNNKDLDINKLVTGWLNTPIA